MYPNNKGRTLKKILTTEQLVENVHLTVTVDRFCSILRRLSQGLSRVRRKIIRGLRSGEPILWGGGRFGGVSGPVMRPHQSGLFRTTLNSNMQLSKNISALTHPNGISWILSHTYKFMCLF